MTYPAIKILIVDDEVAISKSLQDYFEDFDFEVKTAVSSEQAFELLKNNKFDLGIIDLRLPGQTGDEFIIQACQINPKMKFFIHTGSVDFMFADELKKAGLQEEDIFYKPQKDLISFINRIKKIFKAHSENL